MRLVLLIAALLLFLAGCGPRGEPVAAAPLPPPMQAGYIEPLPGPRPGPSPLGIGMPRVHRVTPAPRCQNKTKTVVNNGVKRTVKYQSCR
jgi:hypothetical protein